MNDFRYKQLTKNLIICSICALIEKNPLDNVQLSGMLLGELVHCMYGNFGGLFQGIAVNTR